MRTNMKRAFAGMAAVAVASAGLAISSGAAQAAPGDPSVDTPPVTPISGNSDTVFTMPPRPSSLAANCSQDSATGGFRWNTFQVEASVNVNDVNFGGLGPTLASNPTAFVQPLWSTGGSPQVNNNTAPTTGQIIGFNPYTFNVYPAGFVPAGDYKIGYACSTPTGVVDSFYQTIVRVTTNTTPAGGAGQFTWTTNIPADAPGVPTAVTATAGATSATVTFTPAPSGPGVGTATSFVVTAVPTGGGAPITVSGAASPLTLTGLTNGTAYAVTVVATNGGGSSAASSPAVNVTPVAGAQPAINFTTAPGTGSSTVSFTAPVAGVGGFTAVPTSYTLTVSPAPASPGLASYTIPAAVGSISQLVEGLTPGVAYTATLSPTYAGADNGPSVSRPIVGNSAQIIQQRITVTRPVGQLILTQRCGVNGAIPGFTGTNAVPGFPTTLPAIAATANQTGTSPDITPAAPGLPADAVTVDPEFDNYPFPSPATYPTECGINLGTSTIVTSGAGAGLYFKADGFINEVTVSDTRDADAGWTLNGTMNNFIGINTPANTFDGDWMGWVPQLQNNTANQTITTGGTVLPGTGVLNAGPGLGSGALLGSAPAGAGLGITEFDARLLLLIPTNTPTDDYVGLLDFTVA